MTTFPIPKPFRPLLDPNVRKIVEESGRSTGKSTTNETLGIALTLQSKYNNVLYMRAEQRDLRDIFNSTISTMQALGVERFFEYKTSPFEITCIVTGAKIYFRGINGKTADDLTATKGFTPQYKTLALAILDEANEVKCFNHVRAAETTVNKFLLPNAKIIYAYNPPSSRKHWANREFAEMVRNGATKIHSTWEDIRKLLKAETISEIERIREQDPKHYAFWYGGEIVSLEGAVIWSFDRKKHLIPVSMLQERIRANIYYQPVVMFYGVDSGITSDATAISAWGFYPDGRLIKLDTMYFDIAQARRMTNIKGFSHTDQVIYMLDWYKSFRQRMSALGINIPPPDCERWCFDGAALTQDLMLEWEKTTHYNVTAVTNKDIERDIARLVNSFKSDMLFILDTHENAVSVEQLETFSYDENNEIPDGQADHTIDADKYATYEVYYNYI
ncbi:MAG: phage terminase large subunit [Clostridiales bacterium]|nr:phage terminase large subunit [Clostridiales bacterium]